MRRRPYLRDELIAISHRRRHVEQEHRKAREDGRVRRHLAALQSDLAERFENLLARWVDDEPLRQAWRDYLHRGGDAPDEPVAAAPLAFRGVGAGGQELYVWKRGDRDFELEVDGASAGHQRTLAIDVVDGVARLHVGGVEYRERFSVDPGGRETLAAFVAAPEEPAPWERLGELLADGLIEKNLGLTDRGRRALAHPSR
jgi:hypothetical protein